MKLIWLAIIMGLKSVLTKLTALGIIMVIFLLKDKSLCFSPGKWGEFIFSFSKRQIKRYVIIIYTASAFLSSLVSYFALTTAKFQYAVEIAALLFFAGFAVRGFQFYSIWNSYILDQWQKVHGSSQDRP